MINRKVALASIVAIAVAVLAVTGSPPTRAVHSTRTSTPTPTPLPNNVQFSAASYTAGEGNFSATITVTRTGNTSGAAQVDYATADGSAQQTTDYTITIGTLSFAANETSKSFAVPMIDDRYSEGDEFFSLTLSNPVDATLGTSTQTLVTITDNDSVGPTTNPLDSPDAGFFVRQHYLDFLSRTPDPGGFGFWTGQITQCGTNQTCIHDKHLDVSNSFFYELEYQQTAAFVFRLYRAAFGNNQPFSNPDNSNPAEANKIPSYAAFSLDRARLIGSANLAQDQLALANLYVARTEFLTKYPANLTLDQFVEAILLTIRSDDGADLTGQRAALVALGSRGAVMYRLADDNLQTNPLNNRPFIDAEYNRTFVASQYFGYLRRDADIGGFLFWLGQVSSAPLRDVAKQHAMVCSFITSEEYQLRFSSAHKHTNAECSGGPLPAPDTFKLAPAHLDLNVSDDGNLLALSPPDAVTWTSSNPVVVTVDATGRLKALSRGNAIITASSGGSVLSSTVNVYQTTAPNPDPTSESLISTALTQNRISAEQALMYRIFAIFGDERLPGEFRGAPSTAPHHLLLRELATIINSLSPATQDVLRPFLVPPIYSESWYAQRLGLSAAAPAQAAELTRKTQLPSDSIVPCKANEFPTIYKQVATQHFNIHYLGGAFASASIEVGVALVASLVEEVYDADTGVLQRSTLSDINEPCNGGDNKYDIYYIPAAVGGVGAWTNSYPTTAQNVCSTRPSYMMINSFSPEFYGASQQPANARLLVKSILAHEFLHALQFAMPRPASCNDEAWIDEATAQWVMDYVVPSIPQGYPGEGGMEPGLLHVSDNYLKSGSVLAEYLYSDHMKSIEKPGFEPKLNGYADYLFFQYLARKQTPNKIKQIFDAMVGGKNSVEAITGAVDMKATWPEFAKTLWIGVDDQVLDYWAKEDEYQFGLSRVFAQVPVHDVDSGLTNKLKSLPIDQKGKNHAEFDLLDNALEFGGDYVIEPRSIFYEHLKFTDATVHYVEFYNPIAGNTKGGTMKVQAVKKIGGQWKDAEDWTDDGFKLFCLDKKDERLEELLIIVSNSGEMNRAGELPYHIFKDTPMRVSTSNVGCWRWEGTASQTTHSIDGPVIVENVVGAVFNVFRLPGQGRDDLVGFDIFQPAKTGTVSYNIDGPLIGTNCTVFGTASAGVQDTDGQLIVNYLLANGLPLNRMVIGSGRTNIPAFTETLTCTGKPPEAHTFSQDAHWLSLPTDGVPVSEDGQTISGRWDRADPEGVKASVWNFKAVREQ